MKLVIFDLDGVLVSTKETHYAALNEAIRTVAGSQYTITEHEHVNVYDGMTTWKKLALLTETKGLDSSFHQRIHDLKQRLTVEKISGIRPKENITKTIESLKIDGHAIACCSNCIRASVYGMLYNLGILPKFDLMLSNEDVSNPKPHPEIYWTAMSKLGFTPEETVIVEDSPHGLLAAQRSGAKVVQVKTPEDVTYSRLHPFLKTRTPMKPIWQDEKLNILIPMAGAGSRFEQAGYTFPKPLIEVNGKPMIQVVVDNLQMKGNFIFLTQKSHRKKYNLDSMLSLITSSPTVLEVDGVTEGAACTTLLAKDEINNDNPLIIANSDQYVEWCSSEFMYKMQEQDLDGGILTFKATHPKWSFARTDENDRVVEVAEKDPISDNATVGIYYWKRGSDYVRCAEKMIAKDIRYNGEFYVCPVYQQAVEEGLNVKIFEIEKMWGLGTPEDLNRFLDNEKRKI